jgi:PST family polysaccharide transporter
MDDLKERAVRGGFAKLCAAAVKFGLRIAYIAVLSRILSPEDYGIVGMVTIIIGIISILTNAWLSSGSVQQATIDDRQLSTLFWTYLAFGAALCLVCVVIAPALADFYHEPRLISVTAVLGLSCLFTTAGVQHFAILQRQMRYVAISLIEVVSLLVSIVAGAAVAVAGFGYWALIVTTITLPAFNSVCLWLVTRWVPGRPDRTAAILPTLGFGGLITLNMLVVYIAYNLDKMLIGRVWGAEPLGIYGRAYQIASIPSEDVTAAVTGVAFSALSRLQDDPPRFRTAFLRSYLLVISITMPVALFLAIYADDIVRVLLGPQWGGSAETLRLLSPTVVIFAIINPLGWLMFSAGLVTRSLCISLVIAPLVITAYFIGLPYGPNGVALAFSIAMTLWLLPHLMWSLRGTIVSLTDLVRSASRSVLAAGAAAMIALCVQLYWGGLPSPILNLLLGAAIMGAIYIGLLLFVLGQKELYVDLLRDLRKPPGQVQPV